MMIIGIPSIKVYCKDFILLCVKLLAHYLTLVAGKRLMLVYNHLHHHTDPSNNYEIVIIVTPILEEENRSLKS